jgi:nitroreductase
MREKKMETIDAIKARRAVKHYDPTHQLSDEEEGRLIDLAMQTPSSYNIQHWLRGIRLKSQMPPSYLWYAPM